MGEPISLSLSVECAPGAVAEIALSVASVADALVACGDVPQHIVDLAGQCLGATFGDDGIELAPDFGALFRIHAVDSPAGRAGDVLLRVEPDGRYAELVSAVAAVADCRCDVGAHGWPILSVVSRPPTVAGRGGAASLTPEGAHPNICDLPA